MKQSKKIYMWYKIQELKNRGLNKSQMSRETGLDRGTVRKYLKMEEEEFHEWIKKVKNMPLKLLKYMPFVKQELERFPDLSAAQIEDHLKEQFSDLPQIHSKTVYNFVQTVRTKYDIPKPNIKEVRPFEQLAETPYGQQAQVDFGETYLQTASGKRQKVYFFVMVLSRSRYKYITFRNKPFTTKSSVVAHELSFAYFKGVPEVIIYDQDSVFIHDENLGDYKLTKGFTAYTKTQPFKVIFCRKADPQSKGKVENVVKYVKQNFLRGRKYKNLALLNEAGLAWLSRTGNAKKHSSTQLFPNIEWQEEQKHLLHFTTSSMNNEDDLDGYKVRKDNTIAYKGNFYSLPIGTYKSTDSKILLEAKDGILRLYNEMKEMIAKHDISIQKGKLIKNPDHTREKSKTLLALHNQALKVLGTTQQAIDFLKLIEQDKTRYYRDNLQMILKIQESSPDIIRQSIAFCIENKQYNANVLKEIITRKIIETEEVSIVPNLVKLDSTTRELVKETMNIEIDKSNINTYETIIQS